MPDPKITTEMNKRLRALNQAIWKAVTLIDAEHAILDLFFEAIADPALLNAERRRNAQVAEPLYRAARDLVDAYKAALQAAPANDPR